MDGAGTNRTDAAVNPPLKRRTHRMARAAPSRAFGLGPAPDQLERKVM
jgi:hypothetical protein